LRVAGIFTWMFAHERRHLFQAENVKARLGTFSAGATANPQGLYQPAPALAAKPGATVEPRAAGPQ
jgi:hypothetical protein